MRITDTLYLNEGEILETFIRSTGPGGQNVNKVASAVQLRFNVLTSPSLPEDVRQRLLILARNRITKEGILVLTAQRFRTQEQNRQDARERLATIIHRALEKPKKRLPTRPPKFSQEERLKKKAKQSRLKRLRQAIKDEE